VLETSSCVTIKTTNNVYCHWKKNQYCTVFLDNKSRDYKKEVLEVRGTLKSEDKSAGAMAQVVKQLSSKHEALCSNPSTIKKNQR
jgi:hypothetical protein